MNDRHDELLERLVASERRNRLLIVGLLTSIVISTMVVAFPAYSTQSSLEKSIREHRLDTQTHIQRTEDVHAEQTNYIICGLKLASSAQLDNLAAIKDCEKESLDSFQKAQGLSGQPQTRDDHAVPKPEPAQAAKPQEPGTPQPKDEGLIPDSWFIIGGL